MQHCLQLDRHNCANRVEEGPNGHKVRAAGTIGRDTNQGEDTRSTSSRWSKSQGEAGSSQEAKGQIKAQGEREGRKRGRVGKGR